MRIGIFHNRYRARGGEDAAVDAEKSLLEKAGHEVDTLSVDNRDIVSPADVLRTARNARRNPATIPLVHHFLDEHPIDVAHVHNFFPLFTPSLHTTLKVRGVPVVQTLHNYRLLCANGLLLREDRPCEDCVTRGPWNAVRHGCFRGSRLQTLVWSDFTAYHRKRGTWRDAVDLFVTPSRFAERKLAAADIPPERLRVVPNAVPDPGEPGRLGHGGVYVGRLSREKGVDRLLEAWRSMGDAPLAIVGDGPEREGLEAAVRALPNVRLLGEQSREGVLRAVSAAAFLVSPSRCYEVAPLSVSEAMASGRAVVAPEHGAVAELMEPGRTGLLYRDDDIASLSAACQTLHEDRELARSFGIEARALYRAEFAPEPATAALVAALESVRSGPKAAPSASA
jgi:glycosyltransferase involved in cell wall biosynthesis